MKNPFTFKELVVDGIIFLIIFLISYYLIFGLSDGSNSKCKCVQCECFNQEKK